MLACWLTCEYFNIFQTIVNKKMTEKEVFFGHPREGGDPVCLLGGLTFPTNEYCFDLHPDCTVHRRPLGRPCEIERCVIPWLLLLLSEL